LQWTMNYFFKKLNRNAVALS